MRHFGTYTSVNNNFRHLPRKFKVDAILEDVSELDIDCMGGEGILRLQW